MSDRSSSRSGLLRALLETLVDEWGFEVVSNHLAEVGSPRSAASGGGKGGTSDHGARAKESQTQVKPTAVAMAERVSLPPVNKELVQLLAGKYDSKRFLPTAGDIRYFFEVHGETVPLVKQRSEAFRGVLRLLSSMPESALRKLIESDAHSGPSSLAPLSDAIRGVGEHRPGDRTPDDVPSSNK